ncbi:arylsulfatase [Flammeovirgaceae bacterium SG7u.111]|nr:arylsulfatase [Flammeovirgaceae bacterium SG7u.132]WPO38262.1 arylsulfatase [Flammeovirgaceae bacterium SG7u.111]
MKTFSILTSLMLLAFFAQAQQPNVIVVLADDIGVGDISHYRRMHSDNIILETPNIDKLATSGMVFTDAHAPAALCATSRYSIMTGNSCYRSPFPWGVWSAYAKSPIADDQLTLGKLMMQAGYQTAFFGKWHLGGDFRRKDNPSKVYRTTKKTMPELDVDITKMLDGPPQKGFDYSFTLPAGIQDVPYAAYENGEWYPLQEGGKIVHITQAKMDEIGVKLDKDEGLGDNGWDPRLMGPLLATKAVDYIAGHSNKEKPFFMYYCSQAVHLPHNPPVELNGVKIAGTTPSAHMDMIKELDVQMGMMVAELKKQGVYENTIFIFTSDNGGLHVNKKTLASGHKPSDIYRGSKNTPFEGGHRVPFIVSWPAEIAKKQIATEPILGLDIMATLAAITKTKIEEGQAMDSYNLLPILQNKKKANTHPYLMVQGGSHHEVLIIDQGWKLIVQVDKKDKSDNTRTPTALFNLNENIVEDEKFNLIKDPKYQAKAQELFEKYNVTRNGKAFTGKHF